MISHANHKVKDNFKRKENQVLTNSSTSTVSLDLLHRGKNSCGKPFTRSRAEGRSPPAWHWFNYLHRVNEYQTLLLNSHRVHSPTVIWTLNPPLDMKHKTANRPAGGIPEPASPGPGRAQEAEQDSPTLQESSHSSLAAKEALCNTT